MPQTPGDRSVDARPPPRSSSRVPASQGLLGARRSLQRGGLVQLVCPGHSHHGLHGLRAASSCLGSLASAL
eukprot:431490-Lingulodinium_polyedra.AAC.1